MLGGPYQSVLRAEFSGERAREHVFQLGEWYRSPGSAGYHAAIDYVLEALSKSGVRHETMEFPLGGGAELLGEQTPLAWEPRSAVLELLRPETRTLMSWADYPSSIPWWVPPTPSGGIELGVVDVGSGLSDEDYADRDVRGKAVLVSDSGENFAWLDIVDRAERHGVAALLTDYLLYQFEPWRTRTKLGDAVQQLRLRPKRDNPWAVALTADSFRQLRALALDDEEVTVRLEIDSAVFEGTSRSVLATVGGEAATQQHVVFVAHVTAATKPGANCASGVALLLELAATLERSIKAGLLPRPKRSIHFLFGNEDHAGTALATERPEIVEHALGAVAVCSVGHDQTETKSALIMSRSPDALPSFLNDLSATMIDTAMGEVAWPYRIRPAEIPLVRWKCVPYTPWSDNVTWTRLGVPSLLCMSLPDRFFHTQLLTPEKTDPRTFDQAASVLGATAMVAASAGPRDVEGLMRLVASAGTNRLARVMLTSLADTSAEPVGDSRPEAALERIAYLVERDVADMRSTLRLLEGSTDDEREAAASTAEELEQALRFHARAVAQRVAEAHGMEAGAAGGQAGEQDDQRHTLVPIRTERSPHGLSGLGYRGGVAFLEKVQRRDPAVRLESLQLFIDELWRLSDGRRTVDGIALILRNEFEFDIDTDDVLVLAEALRTAGCLQLTDQSPSPALATVGG